MKCQCPKCGHEFDAEFTSSAAGSHYLTFKLTPFLGDHLTPSHVGKAWAAFDRLTVAIAKQEGFNARVVVHSVAMEEDGSIRLDALITRNMDAEAMEDAAS